MSTKQAKAVKFHQEGLKAKDIAKRLKTTPGYIQNIIHKYTKGVLRVTDIGLNVKPASLTKVYVVNGEYKAVARDLRKKAFDHRTEADRLDALATALDKVKQV